MMELCRPRIPQRLIRDQRVRAIDLVHPAMKAIVRRAAPRLALEATDEVPHITKQAADLLQSWVPDLLKQSPEIGCYALFRRINSAQVVEGMSTAFSRSLTADL